MASGLGAALLGAAVVAGCQSPMYSGTPDDMSAGHQDRSYVGGEPEADAAPPRSASPTREQDYEYRGGRDPVTGRAKTRM